MPIYLIVGNLVLLVLSTATLIRIAIAPALRRRFARRALDELMEVEAKHERKHHEKTRRDIVAGALDEASQYTFTKPEYVGKMPERVDVQVTPKQCGPCGGEIGTHRLGCCDVAFCKTCADEHVECDSRQSSRRSVHP